MLLHVVTMHVVWFFVHVHSSILYCYFTIHSPCHLLIRCADGGCSGRKEGALTLWLSGCGTLLLLVTFISLWTGWVWSSMSAPRTQTWRSLCRQVPAGKSVCCIACAMMCVCVVLCCTIIGKAAWLLARTRPLWDLAVCACVRVGSLYLFVNAVTVVTRHLLSMSVVACHLLSMSVVTCHLSSMSIVSYRHATVLHSIIMLSWAGDEKLTDSTPAIVIVTCVACAISYK
jgi:hypothetical protein